MCTDLKTWVIIAQIIGVTVAPIGVIVAVCGLWWQIRRARLTMNVELTLKLATEFDRNDFRKIRSLAATELKTGSSKEAEDVFDFFETLGYLVRTGAIEIELAWHMFYEWAHGYWSAGHQQIECRRQERKDPKLWSDFEFLHKELMKVQRRESSSGEPGLLSPTLIQEFLQDEPAEQKDDQVSVQL